MTPNSLNLFISILISNPCISAPVQLNHFNHSISNLTLISSHILDIPIRVDVQLVSRMSAKGILQKCFFSAFPSPS
ncbi:unnamed protein product [Meloidogyne enterolobii]|uniref:Uncharacterized protein n=1 Tax=Meloidogyne enterolobii TaxID=390850 RepID=A0ACB0Z0D4_MELEN